MFCSDSRIDRPVFLQLDDGVGHLLDDQRRDAFRGLVEQHQQRIAHQRARDREHLLFAAAHPAARPVGHFGEIGKQREQPLRRPQRRRRAVGKLPRRLAADVEILQHRQVGEDAPVLGREAEAEPRDLEGAQPGDVGALKTDRALALGE